MGLPNGVLGPVLGGLLGFLGAIVAAVVAFALSRLNRNRERLADQEHTAHYGHELGLHRNPDRFWHQGSINSADSMQRGSSYQLIERYRALEVQVAGPHAP
ncbi:hypothetical protein NPX13_g9021 [Xylaria arbuscula]|uniref:Uncharacterized protein n=1 Tax=Xylaria arbuscula TaxID=114810 RepID=A0A9W8TI33_9PEZI|nr:hypothetical protein NPX13_g9021 [Xylaria arbuscula]